ncbi:tRNA (adenosine(37)-N6)-threonylcarbamoyltransferase complex transferase subunit TsaD [Candidatus Kaiserbacteria bacterium]|nr:tRNA (adenosine(37)-N6)-threonylcarbamoyltransferase complex transferase subunit TsaD [Candidatus Kaiserbacteria bacterium]
MRILGIETSCDETAVCIIEAPGDVATDKGDAFMPIKATPLSAFQFRVLGNALYSQVAIHAPYGGVFPNLAKREHAKNLVPLLTQALTQADLPSLENKRRRLLLKGDAFYLEVENILTREPELFEQLTVFLETHDRPDIDAIAVTHGPGLEPALWVGVNFARALSIVWNIPIVAVNHMEGHIFASLIKQNSHEAASCEKENGYGLMSSPCTFDVIRYPLLSLLISGGHTELVLSRAWMQYERIGQTRDDAVGEAFDKVARILNLPYPGGPQISRLAEEARKTVTSLTYHRGDKLNLSPSTFRLPRPMIESADYDFSFSGLKTAVKRLVEATGTLSNDQKKDLAREFEDAAADVLIGKTLRAAEEYGVHTVLVGGGVSANKHIRHRLAESIKKHYTTHKKLDPSDPTNPTLLIPSPEFATDNAVMIALAGYFHAIKEEFADPATLRAHGNLHLS